MEEGRWRQYHEKEYQEVVLALGITAVMALSLAACGGGTSEVPGQTAQTREQLPDSAAAGGGYSGKTLSIGIWVAMSIRSLRRIR